MKISKLMHIVSVVVGFIGVATFMVAVFGDSESVLGITKIDTLLCSGLLFLITIWGQIASIHHIMLEKNNEVI